MSARVQDASVSNIHGGAVAVGDLGLLILGPSGGGKSALAARMIADWPFGSVRLVADDRALLSPRGDRIVARPHPDIAGRMELRGHGIVAAPDLDAVVLHGVLRLGGAVQRLPEPGELMEIVLGRALPAAFLPNGDQGFQRLISLWPSFQSRMVAARSIMEPAS